jgi:exopolysaccharide biosynthesis WecB/TagA/CpsF family protein
MNNKTILAGVSLPQSTKAQLDSFVEQIEVNNKKVLYFLYSEFVLRANQNVNYSKILNQADLLIIDGRGLEWSNFMLLGNIKKQLGKYTHLSILWNCFKNLFKGFFMITGKFDFKKRTNNEIILGRDFAFELLAKSNRNKEKVVIIGSNKAVQKELDKMYPEIRLVVWEADYNSNLMRDQARNTKNSDLTIQEKHGLINQDNLLIEFPDLLQARALIRRIEPELVLVCLGGATGKQEFFINNIKNDVSINFGIAVGIGAAFDHLGSGEKQKRTSKQLEKRGLEWMFRIITNPKRGFRTWYSIYQLWLLTSLQPYTERTNNITFKTIWAETKYI